MRYTFLFIALLCFTASAFAQEEVQEPEEDSPVFPKQDPLPQEGEFALGFDAVPFLEFLGNIFNGNTGNTVAADFVGNNQQIFGKYFLSDDVAVRGRLRLEQDLITNRNRVDQDNQPDPNIEVTDEWTDNSTFVRLGGGIEYRKGEGRLIGVYGGEASILYQAASTDYEYGNPMTAGNTAPTSSFGGVTGGRFERPVEQRNTRQFGVGLSGFAGIEYFIARKISLGAEFRLGIDYIKDYRQQVVNEYWNTATQSVETRKSITEGGSSWSLDTGNYGGSINVMFYF